MKLSTQVGGGLAALLVVIAALGGWQLRIIGQLNQANRRLADVDLAVSRASLSMRQEIDKLTDLTQRFFVLEDTAYRAELERVRDLVESDLQRLEGLPLDSDLGSAISDLRRRWDVYRGRTTEIEALIPDGERPPEERQELVDALRALRRNVEAMDAAAVASSEDGITESTAYATTARQVALLVGAAALVLVGVLAAWISRSTIRPLRHLAAGSRAIAEGDFDHRVEIEGPQEVRSLAEDFNHMAHRLGEVDAMKSEFLSTVSHDLKAPLASMQETTRLLLEDDSVSQRSLLELHTQSADRLQRMIDDLLDAARLESGTVEFDTEDLDLVDHCRQVVREACGLFESSGIRVRTLWPDEPVLITADSRFLMRAVWNLVSNASKFSPDGSIVEIRVRRLTQGDDLSPLAESDLKHLPLAILSITDQGAGIADIDKPYIFERFYRSRRHERYASGTGLGLAITRSIVERLGGRIWVEDAPGGGSVFYVLLPVATPRAVDVDDHVA